MKFRNITDTDMTLRGVAFPAGKAVEVDDEALAAKVAAMPEFEQVKRRANGKDTD